MKKNGWYLYMAKRDDFSDVPETVLKGLGELQPALEFVLDATRKLAVENPQEVLKNLQQRGFHLQVSDPLGLYRTENQLGQ